jgi:DNA-binding HxlR family transcriptional regulator
MARRPPSVRGDCFRADCPAREVLNHISNRWGGLVLGALLDRAMRYSEIRARVGGISEKMLAQTLDVLERDGLISRTSHPVVPPHVEYALTSSGRELAVRLYELFKWIGTNVESFVDAQKKYDSRLKSA